MGGSWMTLTDPIEEGSFDARVAPVSREMILNFIAERVLGLSKSY